jgi:DNA-binding protein HU-beta
MSKAASRALVGKHGLTKSILEFSNSNNVKMSEAFAGRLVDHLKRYMSQQLQDGNKFTLESFGTLQVVERAAREHRNPKTQEKIHVGPKKTVRFVVSPIFKNQLNGTEAPSRKKD